MIYSKKKIIIVISVISVFLVLWLIITDWIINKEIKRELIPVKYNELHVQKFVIIKRIEKTAYIHPIYYDIDKYMEYTSGRFRNTILNNTIFYKFLNIEYKYESGKSVGSRNIEYIVAKNTVTKEAVVINKHIEYRDKLGKKIRMKNHIDNMDITLSLINRIVMDEDIDLSSKEAMKFQYLQEVFDNVIMEYDYNDIIPIETDNHILGYLDFIFLNLLGSRRLGICYEKKLFLLKKYYDENIINQLDKILKDPIIHKHDQFYNIVLFTREFDYDETIFKKWDINLTNNGYILKAERETVFKIKDKDS